MNEKILFRCSKLGSLFTEPKLKADKEAGNLSETAKTLINELWLKDQFGYDKVIVTRETMKGLLCEQDGMQLVQQVLGGEIRINYKKHFLKDGPLKNDYIIGTPDCVLQKEDYVEDIKISWDIETFHNAEPTKDNEHQIKGYCWLTGKTKGRICYCLVPTPEELIADMKTPIFYKFGCSENDDYKNACIQIDHNNAIISKIAPELRLKIFEFSFDEEYKLQLMAKIEKARIYYATIKL